MNRYKMSNKNIFRKFFHILAGGFLWTTLVFTSCNVGLGESVDTLPPEMEITYPPKTAIAMGTFKLAGTVSDDKKVVSMKVTLTHRQLKKEYVYTSQNGEIEIKEPSNGWKNGTTWVAEINKKSEGNTLFNGWDLPDGEYFIDVEASDSEGSVYSRRTIKIDNTAPVFIAENLTSLGSLTDETRLSTFGQKISLTGKAKDDSEIQKVLFTVYDVNGKKIGSESVNYEMTGEGVLLARYNSVLPEKETERALARNFNMIYGIDENGRIPESNDIVKRYMMVSFSDAARIYDEPVYENEDNLGVTGFEGKGSGNISTEIYLNTQEFGLENITIDNLADYKKNLNKDVVLSEKLKKLESSSVAVTVEPEDGNFDRVNKLQINPEINPKWYVDSYGKDAGRDFNQAYVGSPLTIMFAAGNDNVQFRPANIRVVLAKLKESVPGTGNFDTVIASKAEIEEQTEDSENLIILKNYGGSTALTLSSTESVVLNSEYIKVPSRYRIMVVGKDGSAGDGLDFVEKSGNWYGIRAVKNGVAPIIQIKTEDETWIGPNTESFNLSWTIQTDGEDLLTGYPKVTVLAVDNNGVEVSPANNAFSFVREIENPVRNAENIYTFNWAMKNALAGEKLPMPLEEGVYKYTLTIEAQDKAEGYASKTLKIQVDKDSPKITVSNPIPYIDPEEGETYISKVNGTIEIPVTAKDNKGLKSFAYSINGGIKTAVSNNKISINTLSYPDKTNLSVKFIAEDINGNVSEIENIYYIDQESDRPVIEFANLTSSGTEDEQRLNNSFGLSTGNLINGSVADDDGISKIEVRVRGVDATGPVGEWSDYVIVSENKSSINYNFYGEGVSAGKGLITKDGKYLIQFKVTDKVGSLSTSIRESEEFNILVDGTAPIFEDEAIIVSEGSIINKEGSYYVRSATDISVTVIEGNLSSISVNGNQLPSSNYSLKADSATDWVAKTTWTPELNEESGEKTIIFLALDESGNPKEKAVTIFYDKDVPEIESFTVSPDPLEENGKKYINGYVDFKGGVTDNEIVTYLKVEALQTGKDPFVVYEGSASGFENNQIDSTEFNDGELSIKITVKDRAGNIKEDDTTYKFYVDQSKDRPQLNLGERFNIAFKGKDAVENQTTYNILGKSENNTLDGTIEDDDGVKRITISAYKVENGLNGTLTGSQVIENARSFNVNITNSEGLNIKEDGAYLIKIVAQDSAKHPAGKENNGVFEDYLCIVVDGDAPVLEEIKVAGVSYDGTEINIKGSSEIKFKVTDDHLKQVKVNGNTVIPDANSICSYIFTPDNSKENSQVSVTIVATDASNAESVKEISLFYDSSDPVIHAPEVSHMEENTLNGVIDISGYVEDNVGIKKVTVTVKDKSTGSVVSLKNKKGAVIQPVISGENWSITGLDTSKNYEDSGTYIISVQAKDLAGNVKTEESELEVNQTKDAPVITPSLFSWDVERDLVKPANGENPAVNMFECGKQIRATITDDDGIEDITVVSEYRLYGEEYHAVPAENITITNGTLVVTLPAGEGKYQIKVTVTDSKNESKYHNTIKETWIGVSAGKPTVTLPRKSVQYVTGLAGNEVGIDIPVSWNGGATAKLSRTISGSDSAGKEVVFSKSKNLPTDGSKDFTDTVRASCSENESAVVTVTYKVENDFGQSDSKSYTYVLDNIAPVLNKIVSKDGVNSEDHSVDPANGYYEYPDLKVGTKYYRADRWSVKENFELEGVWKDDGYGTVQEGIHNGSGIKEFDYYIVQFSNPELLNDARFSAVKPHEISLSDETKKVIASGKINPREYDGDKCLWKQDLYGFKDGKNYLYVRARDVAGNESVYSYFNLNVDRIAPVLELDASAMKLENNVIYVNKTDLEAGNVYVTGKLMDETSFIQGWHAVAVFEGAEPDKNDYPKYSDYNDIDSLQPVSNMLGKNQTTYKEKACINLNDKNDSTVKEGYFKIPVDASKLSKNNDSYADSYKIIVLGMDSTGNSTSKTFTMYFDEVAPVVKGLEITKLIETGTPVIDGKAIGNVNGEMTITGNISDDKYLYSTVVEIWKNGAEKPVYRQNVSENAVSPFVKPENITNSLTNFTYKIKTKNDMDDNATYYVQVVATDRAGNVSSSDASKQFFYVNQSTDKPEFTSFNASGSQASDNVFGMDSWVINGEATDDDGVKKVTAKIDDIVISPDPLAEKTLGFKTSENISIKIPEDISSREHVAKIIVTDMNGVPSDEKVINFIVDNQLPQFDSIKIGGAEYSDGVYVKNGKIEIEVSDDTGISSVEYSLNNTNWKPLAVTSGKASYDNNEANVKYLRVTDNFGRVASKDLSYIVDNSIPQIDPTKIKIEGMTYSADKWWTVKNITISGDNGVVSDENLISSADVVVTGQTEDKGSIGLNTGNGNSFSEKRSFNEGSSTLVYKFEDKAGNKPLNDLSLTINIDTEEAIVSDATITLTEAKKINDSDVTANLIKGSIISGTFKVQDKTSGLSKAWIGTSAGFAIDAENPDWTFNGEKSLVSKTLSVDTSLWNSGNYDLWIRVQDKAGNISNGTKIGSFVLDNQNPRVTINSVKDASDETGIQVNGKIELTGTVRDDYLGTGETTLTVYKAASATTAQKGDKLTIQNLLVDEPASQNDEPDVWKYKIDTTKLTGSESGFYWFEVSVVDKVGNIGSSYVILNPDQNTDCPVIDFDKINPDSEITIDNEVLTGKIRDDDWNYDTNKQVQKLEIYLSATIEGTDYNSGWESVNVDDNGNWAYTVPQLDGKTTDASYTVKFRVQDNDNTLFETGHETNAKPQFKYNGVICSNNESEFRFAIDSNPPYFVQNNEVRVSVIKNYTNYETAKLASSDNDTYWGDYEPLRSDKMFGGMVSPALKFRINVRDAKEDTKNLNLSVSVNGGTERILNVRDNWEGSDSAGNWFYTIDLKDYNGLLTLLFNVWDSTLTKITKDYTLFIDNAAPDDSCIGSISPSSEEELNGTIEMSGTVSDETEGNSGIVKLEITIPKKPSDTQQNPTEDDWTEIGTKDANGKVNISWTYTLQNLTNPLNPNVINTDFAGYEVLRLAVPTGLYRLPLWFRLTDAQGNEYINKVNTILFNPNADMPKVEISEPRPTTLADPFNYGISYATLGGTIFISGGASDNEGVEGVYLQYDVNGDNSYDNNDKTWLENKGYTVVTVPNTTDWGIKADGTLSWQTFFNAAQLIESYNQDGIPASLEVSSTNSKTLNIRVCVADSDSDTSQRLTSAWSEPVRISVNNSFPNFGQFKLVQYDLQNNPIKTVNYVKGVYIKGDNWFLEGEVTDNGDITEIIYTNASAGFEERNVIQTPYTNPLNNHKGVQLKIPVVPNNLQPVELQALKSFALKVTAKDDNDTDSLKKNKSDISFEIKMDNEAPAFFDSTNASETNLTVYKRKYGISENKLSSDNFIQNDNNYTKFISKARESGSGFDKALFYVLRKEKGNDRIYNVMEDHGSDNKGNRTNVNSLKLNADNLYVLTKNISWIGDSTTQFAVSDSKIHNNKNIRPGSAVIIRGNYLIIDSVDRDTENSITVQLKSPADSTATEADFVYAMVVDNSGETRLSNGLVDRDDNDGMCEHISSAAQDITWEGQFDSSTIPDGPIELHVVLLDNAGNSNSGKIETRASNNAPRLTQVRLGTDLNGDGTIQDVPNADANKAVQEYTTFYARNSDLSVKTEGKQKWFLDTSVVKEENGEELWTIKDKLDIIPEFVGGTYPLYYVLETPSKASENATEEDDLNVKEEDLANLTKLCDSSSDSKKISYTSFDPSLEGKSVLYNLSFWDSTELSKIGSETGYAVLSIKMKQQTNDGTAPKVVVDRFHWNGLNDNNIYGSDKKDNSGNYLVKSYKDLAGHIELESELPNKLKSTGSNGMFSDGAKVSGKITITGTFYDEKRLKALYLFGDGNFEFGKTTVSKSGKNVYTVATFKNGIPENWTAGTSLDAETPGSWYFQITSNTLNQHGHTVTWKLDLDTERMVEGTGENKKEIIVKKGFAFKAVAEDDKAATGNISSFSSETNHSPNYDMDVVPYITGVSTVLYNMTESDGEVYSRSALGHYPVRAKAKNITTYSDEKQVTSSDETITLTGFNMPSTTVNTSSLNASGEYSVAVSGISSINNLNDNDAHGSADELQVKNGKYGVCENYRNGYNRQGNSTNKNLTDDVYFNVWGFNNRAALPVNGDLTGVKMQINQKSGLIQYAFANGGNQFSMGTGATDGTEDNSGSYSSKVWIQDYDTFQSPSVGFHVNGSGVTYATGNGGDTNQYEYPDYFGIMKTGWDVGTIRNGNLEDGNGFYRLEHTTQTNGSTKDMDKERIQSVSMATSAANFYIAYYDNLNDEIRFRARAESDLAVNTNAGMFKPVAKATTASYTLHGAQLIAGKSITGRSAGRYVDIDVVPAATGGTDTVVAVWSDGKTLKYSYKTNPLGNNRVNANDAAATNWAGVTGYSGTQNGCTTLPISGGTDCQIVVDKEKHIHIAANGGNGDLYYIYMATYNSTPQVVLVDSNDTVGGHLTLDVALNDGTNKKPIPYIGYFNQSQKKPKYAYLVEPIGATVPAGVDENGCFTGSWEVETVPSESRLIMNTDEKINIGVWKTSEGVLTKVTTHNSTITLDSDDRYCSRTYSNGTENGVLAYRIARGGNSCLETVQKR